MNSSLNQQLNQRPLMTAAELKKKLPLPPGVQQRVDQQREQLKSLLAEKDSRFLAIVGPCSVHDREATLDYAQRLAELQERVGDQLLLVMRVYVEKPRTCLGWKGLVTDPQRDGQIDINTGLQSSRQLMLDVIKLGLPVATEALNPHLAGYFDDLVSWYALGARTTESQTHREMASGLPGVIGFKNATDGSIDVAIHAMKAAAAPQVITRINAAGQLVQEAVVGNADSHLVLRGGKSGPNYESASLLKASRELQATGVNSRILVDASHANCGKIAERQVQVLEEVAELLRTGHPVLGIMMESFLRGGNQPLQAGPGTYGQSMTDPCLDWEATQQALLQLAVEVKRAQHQAETA
ncbi:3-deoxy-D-arabinoheptulosonate-7-phosphate synthase [Marinospirillum celere]|uniref:Phospho-2-dehydro-3-deoxyheptonate aldolase n=1 Tax=Marinospirillum celere TaxID=1122252 RepID=A0A1I1FE13_9GAMM|nr:3-deoxy-7-phosphoheptulonate synthase [Marinospirillum celere]SFB97637.1 3-deoxy-D-arabinoheptulosonate-7-phosphate synthase [Marinospirillum celere]